MLMLSKWNEGIKADEEGWFSVTPEVIAKHVAERARCDLVIDAFCGIGGSAIQLAMTCERVIAIDIRPEAIQLARHNAAIYGVADRIEFIVGDSLALLPHMRADVVLLAPPWGGPAYSLSSKFDLESMITIPGGGVHLYNLVSLTLEDG